MPTMRYGDLYQGKRIGTGLGPAQPGGEPRPSGIPQYVPPAQGNTQEKPGGGPIYTPPPVQVPPPTQPLPTPRPRPGVGTGLGPPPQAPAWGYAMPPRGVPQYGPPPQGPAPVQPPQGPAPVQPPPAPAAPAQPTWTGNPLEAPLGATVNWSQTLNQGRGTGLPQMPPPQTAAQPYPNVNQYGGGGGIPRGKG